jgi:hypothetical protein
MEVASGCAAGETCAPLGEDPWLPPDVVWVAEEAAGEVADEVAGEVAGELCATLNACQLRTAASSVSAVFHKLAEYEEARTARRTGTIAPATYPIMLPNSRLWEL